MPDLTPAPDHARADLARAWAVATGPGAPALLAADLAGLAEVLYRYWWAVPAVPDAPQGTPADAAGPARPGPLTPAPGHPVPALPAPASTVGRLTAARLAAGPADPHWLVVAAAGPSLLLALRDGDDLRTRHAGPADVVETSRPGCPPRPGDLVGVLPGTVHHHPGWWSYTGDAGAPPAPLDRLYLDLAPEALPAAVGVLWRVLDATGVPYAFKCADTAAGAVRGDSCVVYLPASARERLTGPVATLVAEVSPLTRGGHQPLTDRPGTGVSRAEDPGHGRSFGQVRCRTVAAAAVLAGEALAAGASDVLDLLVRGVRAAGVDLDRPGRLGPAEHPAPAAAGAPADPRTTGRTP